MPLNILVVISTFTSKEERCQELLKWLSKQVKDHEPDTSGYAFSPPEKVDDDAIDFYVYFQYDHFHPAELVAYLIDTCANQKPLITE